MTMLGAQLDDLQQLGTRLSVTGSDVAGVRDGAVHTTTQVVTGVHDAAQAALDQILGHMEQLDRTVASAVAEAEATQWTGANADRFRDGALQFQTSMRSAQTTTTETFTAFRATIASLGETLESYSTQLRTALTDAEASCQAMSQAVEHQRSMLDQVMNAGLSFG